MSYDSKIKIDLISGCWLWEGTRSSNGYGVFKINNKYLRAHRIAWKLHWGPIPDGLHVLHRCDIRNCVNPYHLFLGTNQDNVTDRTSKGRGTTGMSNGQSKLCDDDVQNIRTMLLRGYSQREISKKFGVHQSVVSQINRGKAWVGI